MADTAIARRYAQAVLGALDSAEEMNRLESDLSAIDPILRKYRALHAILLNPGVSQERRAALLATLFEKLEAGNPARALVQILLERRQLSLLGDVLRAYRRAKQRKLGISAATVTTAMPLQNGDRAGWEAALARAAGTKVQVEFHSDPSLIGGAVAQVGSLLYDGSVRGSLERIRQSLLGD